MENWQQLPFVWRIITDSPDSLSSGIQSYEEANAGARYTIMRPVSIERGYRYLNLSVRWYLATTPWSRPVCWG